MTPWIVLQAALAYLLGSIPSAYIAGRWSRGLDIRLHGSGNVGATNVFRVLGKKAGIAVLLADTAKGTLAVLLLPRIAPQGQAPQVGIWADAWPCVLGLFAVLGHSYTVFLGFKGGKGVASSLGVILGLAPFATVTVLAVFGVVFLGSRMVSAGSLAGAAALPGAVAWFGEWRPLGSASGGADAADKPVLWLALALTALVWAKHIPNIRRILSGTENRFGRKKEGAH